MTLRSVLLAGALATYAHSATAQNVCMPQNMCDFRGFACVSDVEDWQAAYSRVKSQLGTLQSRHDTQARVARNARAKANALEGEVAEIKARVEGKEVWLRERDMVVGDYAALLICVRDAETLEDAKACGIEG